MPRRRAAPPRTLPESILTQGDELAEFLEHLKKSDIVAFDTEFVGEESYRPQLCLLQVATRERLAVLDPFAFESIDPFWKLLLDPRRTVIVHAGREEVRMCRFAIEAAPAVFDVQIAAGLVGFAYPLGYAGLVQEVLGQRAEKGETLTDWRRRPLSPAQIRYAFDDVRYLIPIYDRLRERLIRTDRVEWAEEEFRTFVKRATADDPTLERWRRIKGIGALNRRELAVAREVYDWRESFAARVNRPPRTLLRDDLLIEIARRGLKGGIEGLRGIPRSESVSIQAAIARAAELPANRLPQLPDRNDDPPHIALLANLLGVVLNEYCTREKIAPNLTATVSDLKSLVRARLPGESSADAESALSSGWRALHIRPHLQAVLDGQRVLRVVDPASSTPIAVQNLPSD